MFKRDMVNALGAKKYLTIKKMNNGDVLIEIVRDKSKRCELSYMVLVEGAKGAAEEFLKEVKDDEQARNSTRSN